MARLEINAPIFIPDILPRMESEGPRFHRENIPLQKCPGVYYPEALLSRASPRTTNEEPTMTDCAAHPGTKARWHCPGCGKYWCEKCAPSVTGVCKSFSFCPDCRDFCEEEQGGAGR